MRWAGMPWRDQVLPGRVGAALAERQVVLARAALVAMALDGDLDSWPYFFSHSAWRVRVCRPSSRMVDMSVSKNTRSPTFWRKSATEPGVTVVVAAGLLLVAVGCYRRR